ncbi:hypothetical protein [Roseateles sp.]|jgi:hypothetical protein|uniref:hypothetical protein n=1 Tax=Roseateles sp. TaxID=1971397 RepID=UPI003BA8C8EE
MRLACLLLPLALTGCSHLSVDADGTRHIVGFVALTLPPAVGDVAADSLRLRTVGVALTQGTRLGGGLVLGYSDMTLAAIRQDALLRRDLLLDPMQALQPQPQPPHATTKE